MEGIELKSQQHQAQRLQQLHDEEESFLRDGGDPPSHSHHTNRPTGSNSSSFSRDVRVCTTAYSRLSFPTRAIILFVVSSLLFYGAYEFGLDEGVKKENSYLEHQHDGIGMASSSGVGSSGGTKHADDINSKSGNGATGRDNKYTNTPGAFTKELLQSTRKATKELVNMLNDYYGGEDVAVVMLAGSWQAAWKLDVNLFMDENDGSGANDDDDDVSTTNDAANDDDQSRRNLGKRRRSRKARYSMIPITCRKSKRQSTTTTPNNALRNSSLPWHGHYSIPRKRTLSSEPLAHLWQLDMTTVIMIATRVN